MPVHKASDIRKLMFSREVWADIKEQVSRAVEMTVAGKCPAEIIEILSDGNPNVKVGLDYSRMAWFALQRFLELPPRRNLISSGEGIPEAARLIMRSNKIVVVAGAGISVSCGVPDFRGRNGLYEKVRKRYPELPGPEAVFDINYFDECPQLFYEFAKDLYPAKLSPSRTHRFVAWLESKKKLLRMYTQNIDTLEKKAGIKNIVYCHGSFATASCRSCGVKVDGKNIEREILAQEIPYCIRCKATGQVSVMKPDITFFGEALPREFFENVQWDMEKLDLLLVIGTSLKVSPVSLIPESVPPSVPRVLINRERLRRDLGIDIMGDCDDILGKVMEIVGEKL